MELNLKRLSYEETRNLYDTDKDMQTYVKGYSQNRKESETECLEHAIVQMVAYIYKYEKQRGLF